ncbi:MAG: ATP-binding protein [Verrucomicrobia bacterium]|nr:ATP-binding protein [Verrucomicrobiota bacterium]
MRHAMQRELNAIQIVLNTPLPRRIPFPLQPLWRDWRNTQLAVARIFTSQSEFTANAAHELKTPLAAMRLAGENALRSQSSDTVARETIGFLLEETSRLNDLIDRMLLLARAESGRIPVDGDYLKLIPLLGRIIEHFLPLAEHHGQQLLLESSDDWSVWADPDLLRIAIENCVVNAILHNPRGTVITVTVQRIESGGINIVISDDGVGIPVTDRNNLFDRFFRVNKSSPSGHGLGLPISQWAMAAFGGIIQYHPRTPKGSEFCLLCPETEWDYFGDDVASFKNATGLLPPDPAWVACAAPAQVLARMQTKRGGLTEEEVVQRRQHFGPNTSQSKQTPAWLNHLWQVVRTPFNGILLICIALSLVLNEIRPALIMGLMIILSSTLRLWQERRSFLAIEKLDDSVAVKVDVHRVGVSPQCRVDVEDLVPGDLVQLAPGDMVPADMRLLSAHNFTIAEVSSDGLFYSVAKTAESLDPEVVTKAGVQAQSLQNCISAGTHVSSGSAMGVVLATGLRSAFFRTNPRKNNELRKSVFEQGVRRISALLLTFMAILMPLVVLLNGVIKDNWTESLLFGLAVAVGLTPELLPMVVNVNLARTARNLAHKGLVIKSFSAIHNLGALDILCVNSAAQYESLSQKKHSRVEIDSSKF